MTQQLNLADCQEWLPGWSCTDIYQTCSKLVEALLQKSSGRWREDEAGGWFSIIEVSALSFRDCCWLDWQERLPACKKPPPFIHKGSCRQVEKKTRGKRATAGRRLLNRGGVGVKIDTACNHDVLLGRHLQHSQVFELVWRILRYSARTVATRYTYVVKFGVMESTRPH